MIGLKARARQRDCRLTAAACSQRARTTALDALAKKGALIPVVNVFLPQKKNKTVTVVYSTSTVYHKAALVELLVINHA